VSDWRRLPAPVPPVWNETIASWLHRLAAVHGLHAAELRAHVGIGRTALGVVPGLVFRLAALTGYPAGNLAMALPELRRPEPDWLALRHLAQRACPRCTARHAGGPMRRLFAHHEYLCTRHGYWIGPPDPSRDDPPQRLAALVPELAAAQRTLDRARRRHGWAAVFGAVVTAVNMCTDLRIGAAYTPLFYRWEQRLELVMPCGYRRSLFTAGLFPEVAALAALDAGPGGGAGRLAAARRILRYDELPDRDEVGDSLSRLARDRAAGWDIRPVGVYSYAAHNYDGSPRITDGRRTAEHLTAARYRRDPRTPFIPFPGHPLPYAHTRVPPPAAGELTAAMTA
jgi:TniQ